MVAAETSSWAIRGRRARWSDLVRAVTTLPSKSNKRQETRDEKAKAHSFVVIWLIETTGIYYCTSKSPFIFRSNPSSYHI